MDGVTIVLLGGDGSSKDGIVIDGEGIGELPPVILLPNGIAGGNGIDVGNDDGGIKVFTPPVGGNGAGGLIGSMVVPDGRIGLLGELLIASSN